MISESEASQLGEKPGVVLALDSPSCLYPGDVGVGVNRLVPVKNCLFKSRSVNDFVMGWCRFAAKSKLSDCLLLSKLSEFLHNDKQSHLQVCFEFQSLPGAFILRLTESHIFGTLRHCMHHCGGANNILRCIAVDVLDV